MRFLTWFFLFVWFAATATLVVHVIFSFADGQIIRAISDIAIAFITGIFLRRQILRVEEGSRENWFEAQ